VGDSGFPANAGSLPQGQDAVTATETSSNGSTSEYSPCLTLGKALASFSQAGVGPTSNTLPISPTKPAAADATAAAVVKRGYGRLLLLCAATTTRYCKGTYILAMPGKHPQRIARGNFKIVPGCVKTVALTITGKALTTLQRAHHLTARLTTTAHDGAKPAHHKNTDTKVKLVYE
jgi:hypothetical protein